MIAGNHAIGTVRKFPTLPLNANGVWIDPTGGVWRQATDIQNVPNGKPGENVGDYAAAAPTLPLPDYERLSPLNMPDYAEVAGCSSFKNSNSPTYDTFGAYATTTLVGRQFSKNSYSAPNSVHYNNFINNGGSLGNGSHQLMQHQFNQSGNGAAPMSNNQLKMNIIENKMEQLMNNLNSPNPPAQQSHQTPKKSSGSSSKSVPQTPLLSTMRRNRLNNSINGKSNKLSSYGDKINFGEDGRGSEQPLFMKSKFDGSWQSIPSTTALTSSTTPSNNDSPSHLPYHHSPRHHPMQSSLNQLGDNNNQPKANSHSYLSSFGKSDKV
ncbi:CLUMA_CG006738, isoform A [Clunio marinus]|uniref:CLUMA_CG006738, isoform A n=1 Tax=Clunio marinus TaxID=568069 RepID=A0A1J1I080_9DIPT|nr:CLUMA_CG006738, isoform A [Clunio marinus]